MHHFCKKAKYLEGFSNITVKPGLKAGSYTVSQMQLVIRQFDRC